METAKLGKLAGKELRPTQIEGVEFIKKAREKKKRQGSGSVSTT